MNVQQHPLSVQKIVVLRANALGDYILCVPALDALRAAWPDAEIVYIGRRWHRDFLAGRPGPVDRVVVTPRVNGVPDAVAHADDAAVVEAFFAAMRDEHFDIALQMHGGGGHSNPYVRALGARLSAGFQAEDAPPLDINIPCTPWHNEVLRYIELAGSIGAPPVTVTPRLAVTEADRRALGAATGVPSHPYVVLHPGATDVRRRWSPVKMARIADALAAEGYTVCVTGVAAEAETAAAVVASARTAPRNLCGRLTLPALTALLESAALLVANDTGPLHLARAIGTPTVGIYWIGNLVNAGPVTLRGHRHVASWTTHCPACGLDCIAHDAHVPHEGCTHEVSFVDEASVADVMAHARALLDSSRRSRQAFA